jgi:hypothetical protein
MDLLFTGGPILTMNPAQPRAEALAVKDGRIAALGARQAVERLATERTQRVDLQGRALLPGFIDAHTHFVMTSLAPLAADCHTPPARTVDDLLDRLRERAEATKDGWIKGGGYRQQRLAERRHPTRQELDRVSAERPVYLAHMTIHECVVNSVALRMAGISRETPEPPAGRIGRDAEGEPNGWLAEAAMSRIETLYTEWALDSYAAHVFGLLAENADRHFAAGVTHLHDAAVSPRLEALYRQATRSGALRLPVTVLPSSGTGFFDPPIDRLDGAPSGEVLDGVRVSALKLFADGGVRAATRVMVDGVEKEFGILFYRPQDLQDLVLDAHKRGFQVAIHAHGNVAIEHALDAFEHALRQHPKADPRFRIEHCSLLDDRLIRRITDLGVVVVTQPNFLRFGDMYIDYPGVAWLPYRQLLDAGARLVFSSDEPVDEWEPLAAMAAAITRRTAAGTDFHPDQRVTIEEALRLYTSEAATADFTERERGTLEPGKRADLVVLSEDPLSVNTENFGRLQVEATYVAGERVYGV